MPRMTIDEAIDHALGLQERHPGRWVSLAHPNNRQYFGEDGGKWVNLLHYPGDHTSIVVRDEKMMYEGEPVYKPLCRATERKEIERICSALGLPPDMILTGLDETEETTDAQTN